MCMGNGLCCGGCNVKCICCTEHGRYGLSCLYADTVESMSSASWVCMVCMVHTVHMYIVCLICLSLSCEILLPLNMVDMDQ